MKNHCLLVGYSFPASFPLFMEDYDIHTIHFYIAQCLPLTACLNSFRLGWNGWNGTRLLVGVGSILRSLCRF